MHSLDYTVSDQSTEYGMPGGVQRKVRSDSGAYCWSNQTNTSRGAGHSLHELSTVITALYLIQASAMEVELLGEQRIAESLNSSQNTFDMAIRDTYLALNSASGIQYHNIH